MIDDWQVVELLADIKLACPRFSRPSDAKSMKRLVEMWGYALNTGVNYPPFVYREAVSSYFATAKRDDNAPMPGDILAHCRKVIERVESDPSRREKLYAWREQQRDLRDAALGSSG